MTQQPDRRPGFYYVSVVDGRRRGLLLGPYPTHTEALDRVDDGRRLAQQVDPMAGFFAYGTARSDVNRGPGRLNSLLEEAA